jgi:hypothetical protein
MVDQVKKADVQTEDMKAMTFISITYMHVPLGDDVP